ncbi:MAG: hypothetical protein BMS9Abin29_1871 [Gemmatimonadota bacterium]|nr:MAG: hypothetical protein BMS9Abin29_1871 [Gemmatimonadota bacterium]
MDLDTLVAFLVENAGPWINEQRNRHFETSESLPDTTRAALRGYFEPETLDRARIDHASHIENPPFYSQFEAAGQAIPLDFSVWAGITFGDVILLSDAGESGSMPPSVVFHEMVHVVQYGMLGIDEFARRYVTSLAWNRFQYMTIPLEVMAFELQDRFEQSDGQPFSAEAEIRRQLDAGPPTPGREDRLTAS